MAVYNRYKKLRKAIKYADGTIVYVEPAVYKKGDLISQESFETLEDCMYNYQYRWNKIEVIESDKNTYICEGFSQYYKEVYQKSLDNVHWVDVEPKQERKGDLIKEYSESCDYVPLIEWRLVEINLGNPNTYICDGDDLYTREDEYISYDNGLSYQPTGASRKVKLYLSSTELCNPNLSGMIVSDENLMIVDVFYNNTVAIYDKINSFNYIDWVNNHPTVYVKSLAIGASTYNKDIVLRFVKFTPYVHIQFSHIKEFVNLNTLDTSFLTDMTSMFSQCSELTSLDLSSFNTTNVTNMSSMFIGCINLTTLDLSNFNTSKVTNMSNMFNMIYNDGYGHTYYGVLKSLDLSNFDTTNVTSMEYMFYHCDNLNYIKCKQAFRDWCLANQDIINLPEAMREGGSGHWEIIG